MVISELRRVSQWHHCSNSAYRLLLTLAPRWQLQNFQHQPDRARCSSLLSQEQDHCKWWPLKFAFISWANIVWFLATETMYWPQLKFSFTYVNFQMRMKVWTSENRANPGRSSNTEKSGRRMNMGNSLCTCTEVSLQMTERPGGRKVRKWRALEFWSFLSLSSALPEFPFSPRHLHQEGMDASFHNPWAAGWMERAADLWVPGSAWWIHDLERILVKASEKSRRTFWFLSSLSCCVMPLDKRFFSLLMDGVGWEFWHNCFLSWSELLCTGEKRLPCC